MVYSTNSGFASALQKEGVSAFRFACLPELQQVILRDTAREPDLRERFAHLFDDLLGIGDFEIELIGHICLVKKQAMIQRH